MNEESKRIPMDGDKSNRRGSTPSNPRGARRAGIQQCERTRQNSGRARPQEPAEEALGVSRRPWPGGPRPPPGGTAPGAEGPPAGPRVHGIDGFHSCIVYLLFIYFVFIYVYLIIKSNFSMKIINYHKNIKYSNNIHKINGIIVREVRRASSKNHNPSL